jgi:hypothetical protein
MSDHAKQFVERWISKNVHVTRLGVDGDAHAAKELAAQCWAAADSAGVSRLEIKTSCGDLVQRIAAAIESVNDAEVSRLAAKND